MSGSGISDNGALIGDSNSDYSPNKLPTNIPSTSSTSSSASTIIPQFGQKHRSLIQQRSTPACLGSKQTKFQTPRVPEESISRPSISIAHQHGIKPLLQRGLGVGGYVDHLTGDGRLDSFGRDSSLGNLFKTHF